MKAKDVDNRLDNFQLVIWLVLWVSFFVVLMLFFWSIEAINVLQDQVEHLEQIHELRR